MGGVEREIEEDGFFAEMFSKEVKGFTTEDVGGVLALVFLRAFITPKERRDAVALMGVVVDAVVAVTVEEIEATLQGQVAFGLAHIPLSNDAVHVASGAEHVAEGEFFGVKTEGHLGGDRVFLGGEAVAIIDHVVAHHVVETVALGVAACEDAAA